MNNEFPLIIERYLRCSTVVMLERYTYAPPSATLHGSHLNVTSATVDLQLASKVLCSDTTRNEKVNTSVCRINFDGSSANVTLFSSQIILLLWNVFSWLRVICFLTEACRF